MVDASSRLLSAAANEAAPILVFNQSVHIYAALGSSCAAKGVTQKQELRGPPEISSNY